MNVLSNEFVITGLPKLSMKRQKCIMDYEISLDFSSSWGWADNDRVLVLGWTNPLKQHLHTDEMLSPAVSSLRGYTVLVLCGLFNIFDILYFILIQQHLWSEVRIRADLPLILVTGEVKSIWSTALRNSGERAAYDEKQEARINPIVWCHCHMSCACCLYYLWSEILKGNIRGGIWQNNFTVDLCAVFQHHSLGSTIWINQDLFHILQRKHVVYAWRAK